MKLLDTAIDCRDLQIFNAERYNKIIWQRRLMATFTIASIVILICILKN